MLRPDIPFSRDDANRFLPWMIGLMCALTALMLCVGISLGQWVHAQPAQAAGDFTVQIPPQGEKNDAVLKQALAAIEATPGVGHTRLLPEKEVQALVAPWLGDHEGLDALPFPAVIEGDASPRMDPAALQRSLQAVARGATVDTRHAWAEKFGHLSVTLRAGLYALALAIAAALASMMIFASRAAMKLHAGTVRLLHTIGADDAYIARQFQANALGLALRGAVPGTAAAAALYSLFGLYAVRLNAPMLPVIALGMHHVLMLLVLPLLCCGISVLAVRAAALSQLKQLP